MALMQVMDGSKNGQNDFDFLTETEQVTNNLFY
jgi:hypothetical protein